jgi:hypothetical protein
VVVHQRLHQLHRDAEQVPAGGLVPVLDEDVVAARGVGVEGAPEVGGDAGQVRQLQGDVLDRMGEVGAAAQPLDKAARRALGAVVPGQPG